MRMQRKITRLRRERDLARQERDLLKKARLLRPMRFRFIDAADDADIPCADLQVSVSGFYAWRFNGSTRPSLSAQPREPVQSGSITSLPRMGSRFHRVARLRGDGLSPKRKQKFKKTTDSQRPSHRTFSDSAEAPNEKWAADISYIGRHRAGCTCHARPLLPARLGRGRSHDQRLRALNRAIGLRQPGAGVIHHCDRGSQYCSDAYQARLGELGFLASMSGKGNCNAVVETFFKTIKSNCWTVFMSRSQAETAIAPFYNPVPSALEDFRSPANSRQKQCKRCRAPPLFLDGSTPVRRAETGA